MKQARTFLSLVSLLILSFTSSYAEVNDSCATAIAFPALTANVQSCINGDNLTAGPQYPYSYQAGCLNGNMAAPSSDVWYSFVAVGNYVDINITGNLANTSIAIYEGTCNNLVGRGCDNAVGGNLTTTFAPLLVGNTYFLQVSGGGLNDHGSYQLCLTSYGDPTSYCISDQQLTLTPAPINGGYPPGTTVQMCITIAGYNQNSADWFHGLVPTFGAGWDTSTITNIMPAASCDGQGYWHWYDSTFVGTGGNPPPQPVGPGFFYDSPGGDNNLATPYPDSIPNDNFGDNCTAGQWTFCFDITTIPVYIQGQSSTDCSVAFNGYSDSETGSWSGSGSPCPNDPTFTFNTFLIYCGPTLEIAAQLQCDDDSSGALTAVGNGLPPYTFIWSNGFTEVSNDSSTIGSVPEGTYSCTVVDNTLCSGSQTIILSLPHIIPAIDSITGVVCSGDSTGGFTVSATGGDPVYTYVLNGGLPQSSPTFSNLPAGTYTVTITDPHTCDTTIQVTIPSNSTLAVVLDSTTDVTCFGENDGSVYVHGTGGVPPYQYSIDAIIYSSSDSFNNLSANSYMVTIKDSSGCTSTVPAPVTEPAQITVDAGTPVSLKLGLSTQLDATVGGNIVSYSWLPTDGLSDPTMEDPLATPPTTTTYTLTVTDDNGCTASDTVTIHVFAVAISIPNAFSPNGVGPAQNEYFKIYASDVSEYHLTIFNRWGEMVFETTNPNDNGWDGTYRGTPQAIGTYVYHLTAKSLETGAQMIYSGNVTLLR